ncbi:MAG TPA: hypothetical protein VHW90_14930 [Stellaceae bacterium]|nr:hypothetical protein [Stellaceae bacterium]
MAKSNLSRADRFYQNPILRDEEWDRAKQAPWWQMIVATAIVGVGFFAGVYAAKPYSVIGWIAGVAAIVVYLILGSARRRRARRVLREMHGQPGT